MDPLYRSASERVRTDYFRADGSSLYYELRGGADSPQKVVLLTGPFGTLRHLDQLADHLADADGGAVYEVLSFDSRGTGRSSLGAGLVTSEVLASDALALLSDVWPTQRGPLHVYGASMGGMVAQKLAVLLMQDESAPTLLRLSSLFLTVTARSYGACRYLHVHPSFLRLVLPYLYPLEDPQRMVQALIPKLFPGSYLDSSHPATHQRVGDMIHSRWTSEYNDWFSFGHLDAVCSQACAAGLHYLEDNEVSVLVASGVPILVHIALRDELVPASAQKALAHVLKARVVYTASNHLGTADEFAMHCRCVADHFRGSLNAGTANSKQA